MKTGEHGENKWELWGFWKFFKSSTLKLNLQKVFKYDYILISFSLILYMYNKPSNWNSSLKYLHALSSVLSSFRRP